MRFKLFGFKGTLQTFEEDNKKEKRKTTKDEDNSLVVCTGYRPYVAFDERPVTPVPVRSNQASTSQATKNGAVPKAKPTKDVNPKIANDKKSADKKKEQPKPVDKVKVQKPVDNSKEQKGQKVKEPKVKEQKSKEQKVKGQKVKEQKINEQNVKEQKVKEQKTKDIKGKETKSTDNKKEVKAKTTQNKDSKEQKVNAEKVKETKPKESKEKAKASGYAQNSKSASGKPASKKSKPPGKPVTDKTPLLQADNPAFNLNVTKAQSAESINGKRNYHEDDDSETDTGGFLTVVTGKTKSAAPSADDNDKSTLIFMTEDHGDGEDYEDINRFRGKSNNRSNERDYKAQSNYSDDYSNHAASIFFSGSEPEPPSRTRNFRHRDDDDNGSQTSA